MNKNPVVGYSVILTMLLNLNAVAISAAVAGASSLISLSVFAEPLPSDTPKLDELKAKYDLENPNRNHQSDTFDPALEAYFTQPARDKTAIMGEVLSDPVPTRTIDLSGHDLTRSMAEQLDMAKSLSKTHSTPAQDGSGYKSEYAKSGTRVFSRDENGKLQMSAVEGVSRVSGLNDNDMLGAESLNTNYDSQAEKVDLYGDNIAIFNEGENIHNSYKDADTGKTAAARGYRAITRSSQRGIDTNILETDPFLQPSFEAVSDAQDPNLMFSACTEVTRPVIDEISVPNTTEHRCQDLSQINRDFCEVERDIKIPAYANTPGLRSCGPGCYEFDMNIDVWKTSKCRRTTSGDGSPATFTLNLNPSAGIAISSVTLVGVASDHFRYTLNGQTFWESTGSSQGPIGNIESGSCNQHSHTHQINTNITARVNDIVGPLPEGEMVSLDFRADIRWKRSGGMTSVIRIQLEDTTGEGFETKFIQYPEKCYDALSLVDKLERGLDGVYDWEEIGIDPNLPPIRYQCTSVPVQPVCSPGEIAFGSAGQELCYAEPLPPQCDAGEFNSLSGRCEYAADISCELPPGPISCGGVPPSEIFVVARETTYDPDTQLCTMSDAEHCGSWSQTYSPSRECPEGGTLDGELCHLPAITDNQCDVAGGYALGEVIIEGEVKQLCSATPNEYTSSTWTCDMVNGEPQFFSDTYCTVYREDFLDEYGNYIPTIDENGFPLPPPVDEEGVPITFLDIANCIKPQELPDVPEVEFPSSFCTFDEYQSIEDGDRGFPSNVLDIIPPFYDGDMGNKTWKVNLKGYRCDPTDGQIMCRIDPDTGEETCTTWEDLRDAPDQCAVYKEDPTCVETSRICTDGWLEDVADRCMSDTVTYECTTSSTIDYETEVTTNSCTGMLPCMGGDCEFTDPETNPNFVKAMVAGSIIDESQDGSSCTDPADPSTCTIFDGEYKYCSWETTGLGMDCCEEAAGVDIFAYVTFSRQMLKVGQMAGSGAFGSGVQGMYSTLSEPITSAGQAISNWSSTAVNEVGSFVQGAYSSTMNSLLGSSEVVTATGETAASVAGSAAGEGMTAAIEAALASLQQEVYSFVYNMLPDTLANLIFTETANVAVGETSNLVLNETLTNFMSNVMAVYAAYQMIKLALTLLTACDETEMDMGVKLAQRTCFKVGDSYCAKRYPVIGTCMQNRQNYCCYSSILSRIIMKESYSQLSLDPLPFGPKPLAGEQRDASCPGLTFEQFEQVNFEAPTMQTALQEWIGLLLGAGAIPTETTEQSLTGGAELVEDSCQTFQEPVVECTIDAISLEEVCEQVRDSSGNLVFNETTTDCTYKPHNGQIWNAHGRKTTSERTLENLGTAQDRVQESKNFIREAANSLDCSEFPRPPLCDFGFDPREGG